MKVLLLLVSTALIAAGCVKLHPYEIKAMEQPSNQITEFEVFSPEDIIIRAYLEVDELRLTEKEFNKLPPDATPEEYFRNWAISLEADALIFEIYKEQTGMVPGVAGGWFPRYETTYIGIAIIYE